MEGEENKIKIPTLTLNAFFSQNGRRFDVKFILIIINIK
jgi:hypothetical protein